MASLQFKGKQFVQNHHLTVKFHELVPKKEKSLAKKYTEEILSGKLDVDVHALAFA